MHFVAKLHPHLEDTERENYNGPWLSRKAKEALVERFYRERQNIPLCIDHRDIGKFGYVKDKNRLGRVTDVFINQENELMTKCELFNTHKEGYSEVGKGIFKDKQRWGVSVGLANVVNKEGKTESRNLVHVAITSDPAFAAYGTFLTHYGLSEESVNRALAREYAKEVTGKPKNVFSAEFRRKLEEHGLARRSTAMDALKQQEEGMDVDATKQQPKEGQDAEQVEESGKPLTLAQKREKLQRMKAHIEDSKCQFYDMDRTFKKEFNTLEDEIEKDVEDENKLFQVLREKFNLTDEAIEGFRQIGTNTAPEAAPIQKMLTCFVGATSECFKASNELYAESERDRQALREENARLKAKEEQEIINANNKRQRVPASASPFNYVTTKTTTTYPAVVPKKAEPFVAKVSQQAPQQQWSYLDSAKVVSSSLLNNEKLNSFMNPSLTGFQKPNQYVTKSVSEYAGFQMFDSICNK